MRKFFGWLARKVVRFPVATIVATVALTIALGIGASRLRMDSDMTDDIPSSIPEKAFYDEVGKIFPANDALIVAFSDSQGAYSSRALRQAREWTDAIGTIEDVKGVLSLANATLITGTDAGIVIEPAMRTVPETAAEIAGFRARMDASTLAKALVGRDGMAQSLMVSVDPGADASRRPRYTVSVPASASAADRASLAAGIASLADEQGNPLVSGVYSPGNHADEFAAASAYAVRLAPDRKGTIPLLVRPAPDADLDSLGKALSALASSSGAKVSFSNSQVSMYDRMNASLSLMPSYADGKVYVSGSKAVTSVVGKLMGKDLATLFPIVILLIVVILFLSFRTLRGVMLPLVNVIMATVMAMGFMGWIGQPISMATMVLPIILIAVGTAYAIHVINRYYEDLATIDDRGDAIIATLEHVSMPILLAALTTMIGFGSLAVSSIAALRAYGLLAALGILFALALAVTFTPALLVLLEKPERKTVEVRNSGPLAAVLKATGRFIARKPGVVTAVSLALVALAALCIPLITFESNTIQSFRKGTEIRQASEYLNDNFTGITMMTVVVRAGEDGAILDADVLGAMDSFQQEISRLRFSGKRLVAPGEKGYDEAEDLIGGTQSITTFVRGLNKAMHADDPAWDRVPSEYTDVPVTTERYAYHGGKLDEIDTQYGDILRTLTEGADFTRDGDLVRIAGEIERVVSLSDGSVIDRVPGRIYAGQLVFQYENSGDPEDIESFIDNPRRTARINVFVRTASSTVSRQVQSWARHWISGHFPKDVKADITGLSALNLTIMRLLINTQISSVITSLLIIFVMISLISRSAVEGLFSIIPLSASLVINFGIMGLAGIPVDISTATIASIAIGIGIDYTLHFMERFKLMAREQSLPDAVVSTLMTTGRGIIYNAIAVAGGFVALMFSQIKGNFYMGLLMAIIMVVASAFAITLLPAVLLIAKPGFVTKNSRKE